MSDLTGPKKKFVDTIAHVIPETVQPLSMALPCPFKFPFWELRNGKLPTPGQRYADNDIHVNYARAVPDRGGSFWYNH